jgi:multiple sugar transport system permease protein
MTKEKKEKVKKVKYKAPGPRFTKDKFRKFMLGSKDSMGFVKALLAYIVLISIGFVFIFPLIKMFSTSMMDLTDLVSSSVNWIPTHWATENYRIAAATLDYWNSLRDSIILAGLPTLIQVAISAYVGYGFARFDFRGKKIMMGILILSFVLPPQIITTQIYVLYTQIGIAGSIWGFIVPAALGQGIKAPIFILITMTFYKQVPNVLIEAASIDGAGYIKSFFKIALPSATGALVTVLLFSFVWYWNETQLTSLYVQRTVGTSWTYQWKTLITGLESFDSSFTASTGSSMAAGANGTADINESYKMAGTLISIAPLLVLYFIMQKQFVESIDRVGITGE